MAVAYLFLAACVLSKICLVTGLPPPPPTPPPLPPSTTPPATEGYGCFYGDEWYGEGQTVGTDPCEPCHCVYGQVVCDTATPCPTLEDCTDPVVPEGTSCAECPGDVQTDCILFNGEIYANGEFVGSDDPCSIAECRFGELVWLEADCEQLTCDDPLYVPDPCCPVCETAPPPPPPTPPTLPPPCYQWGREYGEGEMMEDPCGYCECTAGQKVCFQDFERVCPSVALCSSPATLPGTCCPVCPGGCLHEQKWFDDGAVVNSYPCIRCECTAGQVVCYVLPCATDDQPPFDIP